MSIDLSGSLPGIDFEVRDGIAFIQLARPERGNSLTPAMQPLFRAIWGEVRDSPEIRVAVLGAAGGLAVGSEGQLAPRGGVRSEQPEYRPSGMCGAMLITGHNLGPRASATAPMHATGRLRSR